MNSQLYRYKGYDSLGKGVSGEISASSLDEAERKILVRDVVPTAIQAAGHSSRDAEHKERRSGRRLPDGEAALILRNLSVMLEAGVPFVEALEGVAAAAKPDAASHLTALKNELVGGKSVSGAMRAAPQLFPQIVIDMVRVAEEGGRLEQALSSAATHLERSAALRKKILNAMIYPAVMIGVSVLTVAVLIIFVMPRFAPIFLKMQIDLPMTTKVLFATGDAIRTKPLAVLAVAVGIFAGLKVLSRIPSARRAFSLSVRRVPILGQLLGRLAIARAFSTIATLHGANISVMAALEQGAAVAGDPLVSEALLSARTSVERGATLYDSLAQSKAVPIQILQMISVGERTGRLAALLAVSAARMEEEADAQLKALVAMVEPLMIVFMGAIVGTITVSIITPIYSVVEHIK